MAVDIGGLLVGCVLGLAGSLVMIPLLPVNRAWTWERFKAFYRGDMPLGGF